MFPESIENYSFRESSFPPSCTSLQCPLKLGNAAGGANGYWQAAAKGEEAAWNTAHNVVHN